MTKADMGDWKSPLGVYERAIAEITNLREEFKAEIQALRKLQAENASLKSELRSAQAEIKNLKSELQTTNERLENLVTKSKKTTDSVKKAQETADSAIAHAGKVQKTVNTAISEIGLLKTGIENGSIIAQKALMLRGKDDYHWMKFKKLDSVNHHCFQVWKSDDNTWHNDIRVKASTFLRAK